MKVISQETICPCFGDWTDMFPPQVHEVGIVSFLGKYILAIITTIVDVIEISVNEWRNIC